MASKSKTTRLTLGQAIVKYLQVQYSERDGQEQRLIQAFFGIFGHGNLIGLGQAMYEYGQDMPFYQPRNEQSMVHTAAGFAKANYRRATFACCTSIGPGATNLVTGAATATINRLPVLLLPGDYYATRRQGPVLQQVEHPVSADVSANDCLRPVSRFFDRITRPEQILTALPEAMRVLTDPAETGAVTLALPQDIQPEAYDYPEHFFEKRVWRIERRLPCPQRIAEALAMIKKAKRPMIIAGGGVHYSEAWAELKQFSDMFGIPVGETMAGKGSVKEDSPLFLRSFGTLGTPVGKDIAAQADLVVSIGTRLTDFDTGSQSAFQNPDVKFITINVAGHDAFKQGALPVMADARQALRALCASGKGQKMDAAYGDQIVELKQKDSDFLDKEFRHDKAEVMTQGQLILTVNDSAQPGDTIIAAAGTPPGDLHRLWDATGGRNCHIEFGNSCMGYELPASLGVRLHQPKGEVYVLIGDGTYLLQPTEIVTAMQEGLKITVLLSENHGFQSIRGHQEYVAGHAYGTEFRYRDEKSGELEGDYIDLDFAKISEGLGARAWKVRTLNELKTALTEARDASGPCVLVVETDPRRLVPGSGIFWDFAVAEVSNDTATQTCRKRYDANRRAQRFHY